MLVEMGNKAKKRLSGSDMSNKKYRKSLTKAAQQLVRFNPQGKQLTKYHAHLKRQLKTHKSLLKQREMALRTQKSKQNEPTIVLSDSDDDVIEIPLSTEVETSSLQFYECRTPTLDQTSKPIYASPFAGFIGNEGLKFTSTPLVEAKERRPNINSDQPANTVLESCQISKLVQPPQLDSNEPQSKDNSDTCEVSSTVVSDGGSSNVPESSSPNVIQLVDQNCSEILSPETSFADDSVLFVGQDTTNFPKPKIEPQQRPQLNPTLLQKILQLSKKRRLKQRLNTKSLPPSQNLEINLPKRMVILDGSNLAFGHSQGKYFSALGLKLALDHFEKKGFKVKAVVPQFRLRRDASNNMDMMHSLEKSEKLILTPSKFLDGRTSSSYDDRFILEIAQEFDSAIISNDNYKDLVAENEGFGRIIRTRVVGFTWVENKLFIPNDPYGKNGPSLNEILYKKEEQAKEETPRTETVSF